MQIGRNTYKYTQIEDTEEGEMSLTRLRRVNCKQLLRQLPTNHRNYQSLAVGINQLRTLEPEEPFTDKLQQEKLQLPPNINKYFSRGQVSESLKNRLEMLKKLSFGYKLPNDLLIKALFPHENTFINMKNQENDKVVFASTKSIEQMGFNLFKLEKTLFLIEKFGEDIENQDFLSNVVESKLSSKFINNKSILNKYLENSRLIKVPFVSTVESKERAEIVAAKESLYMMIGFIAYRHGKERASQFIKEEIILGKGGLFDVVLEKMNYK